MGKVYRGELPPEHILPPRPKPGTIMPDQDPAAVFERPKIEPQVKSKILCKKKRFSMIYQLVSISFLAKIELLSSDWTYRYSRSKTDRSPSNEQSYGASHDASKISSEYFTQSKSHDQR